MLYRKKENIAWLEFEQLQPYPEIVHGVFLAPLDASQEESCGIIRSSLGIESVFSCKQVHGTHLETAPCENTEGCDGLFTQKNNQGLLIKHADCQATIFFDPIKQVIANVHCGWRGNVQNIYAKTVAQFKKRFQTRPEDLLVCISPSLGPDAAEFIHYEEEFPPSFFPFQHKPTYFDLWSLAKWQLKEA